MPGSETVFFEIEDRDMLADGEIDPTLTAIERQIGQHSLEYALSPEHLAGHLKFCRSCVSCMAGKGQISQARRLKGEDRRPIAEKPGDLLTDFFICGPKSYGTGGEKAGLVVADRYSGKVKSFPTETRSSIFVGESFTDFAGKTPITNLHSDNGEEIIRAAKDLGIVHRTSTPYRHQSNGQAENWVRQVTESTRVSLHGSGFNHRTWPMASIYATAATSFFKPYSRREGDEPMTPYMREFGVEVNALRLPFGAVCFAQFYSEDEKDRPKFEAKREECLFLGWHRHPGGEWSKDYFVVKLQDYLDHPDKIPMPRRVRDVFSEGSSVRMPAFEAKQRVIKDKLDESILKRFISEGIPLKEGSTHFETDPDPITIASTPPPSVEPIDRGDEEREEADVRANRQGVGLKANKRSKKHHLSTRSLAGGLA